MKKEVKKNGRKLTLSMGLTAAALCAYMLGSAAAVSAVEYSGSGDSGSGDTGRYCTDMRGLYLCAAIKIDRMNTIEWGWCMLRSVECLGEQLVYCAWEGCQELGPGSAT